MIWNLFKTEVDNKIVVFYWLEKYKVFVVKINQKKIKTSDSHARTL